MKIFLRNVTILAALLNFSILISSCVQKTECKEFHQIGQYAIEATGDKICGRCNKAATRILVKRNTLQNDTNTKKLVCYYDNQSALRTSKGLFTVDMIDPFLCTHLIYQAFGLDEEAQLKSNLPKVDFEAKNGQNMLKRFVNLKMANPALKTMLSVEGNSEKFSAMAASPILRANFIRSAMDYMTKYNLNGLDIVWKYPNDPRGQPEDKENFNTLIEELRRAFKPRGHLLSAALPVGERRIEAGVDVPQMSRQLDFINLMSYDYNGSWDNDTGLHAPLQESIIYDRSESERELNVAWSIKHWLEKGADPRKLMLGVTSYGRTFTLANPNFNGINAPIRGSGRPGPYVKNDRLVGYNELCEAMTQEPSGWRIVRDLDYQIPYAVKGDQWVSYEDATSAGLKAKYALSKGLGGLSIVSLSMDDFLGQCQDSNGPYPIANSIKRELDRSVRSLPRERSAFSVADNSRSPLSDEVPRPPTGLPPPITEDDGFGESLPPSSITESYTVAKPVESSTFSRPLTIPTPVCGTNGQWWFPGPSCREYYDCTSGKPVLKQCRANLLWKQSNLWCDYPENVPECRQ